MSKILFVCFRKSRMKEFSKKNIFSLSERLEPDNISFRSPMIIGSEKELITLFNPNDSIQIKDKSICHGSMIEPPVNWGEPMSKVPDGSFTLYRSSKEKLEIVTDIVASKTVWYYFDEDIFISSSSQRAIIFFLGSFQFNNEVIPWMLATGGLGPDHSWDKRLKMMKGDSSLILDRQAWKLNLVEGECNFHGIDGSDKYHEERLLNVLQNTIGGLKLDYSKWVLPLSGGYDSRGILYLLKKTSGLRSITWGVKESQSEKLNDAYIAKKLAEKLEIEHAYFLTDVSNEPITNIFNRYLICGEGRVDNPTAYMDGLKIWKDLFESGIQGVIRGDEGFGHFYVKSELDVRMKVGVPLLSDYSNLGDIHDYGIKKQDIPGWLQKKKDETNELWRDRLYHQYRLSHIIAGLHEIKLPFVEVITPLLTRKTLEVVRTLPDNLRTDKKLFRRIVNSTGPSLAYARYDAVNTPSNIYRRKDVIDEIISELKSENAVVVLPHEFIEYLLVKLVAKETNDNQAANSIYKIIKSHMPEKIKRLLRNTVLKKEMDFNILAFRSYIISKMSALLTEDAKILDIDRV